MPAEYVEEVLRRIFVYQFMCPDDFAWAPIDILGVEYDEDGLPVDGMQFKAAAHLVDAVRGQGYEVLFEDPGTDVTETMRHILWDKWSEDENRRAPVHRSAVRQPRLHGLRRCQVHPSKAGRFGRRAPLPA